MFEVHYWPREGRVMTVHIPAGDDPIVMDVRIVGNSDSALWDNTFLTALALAEAGYPAADSLVEHNRTVTVVDFRNGMARSKAA